MDDAAVFRASYAGIRSLTDGDYRISFDVAGEQIKKVFDVLTQGGKPSAAQGTWFAIARLTQIEASAVPQHRPITPSDATQHSAPDEQLAKPARKLSQDAYWLCNELDFWKFLNTERRHAIPQGNHINSVDEAKHVLRAWLEVLSLSELDDDPRAAARWQEVKAKWLTEPRYVQVSRE